MNVTNPTTSFQSSWVVLRITDSFCLLGLAGMHMNPMTRITLSYKHPWSWAPFICSFVPLQLLERRCQQFLFMLGKPAQMSPSQKAKVVLNQMGKDHSGSISTNDFIFKKIYSPEGILIMNEGVECLILCVLHIQQ